MRPDTARLAFGRVGGEPPPDRMRPFLPQPARVLLASCALALGGSAMAASTVYIDGPNASDAQKIATQMLNDAAAGRGRGMDFRRPSNPFDQMIQDYENRRRARALELENYAREAQQNRAEREAEERAMREEQARNEMARRELARFEAVHKEAEELHPMAHVRLGMMMESGRLDPDSLNMPEGKSPQTYAKERYRQAARLDFPLGEVALTCSERNATPGFVLLWETLQGLKDNAARRTYLERVADGGHVGAAFWLGAWAAGKDVGLGAFLLPSGYTKARAYALEWLAKADPDRLGALYADVVLSGDADPATRRRAIELLEKLAVRGEGGHYNAFIALAQEHLRRARFESDMARPRALLGVFQQADIVPGMHALAAMHLDGADGRFQPAQAARVYARMPDKPRFLAFRAAGHVYRGLDAILGVEQPVRPSAALEEFNTAAGILDRTPGLYRPADRWLKVETALWRAFARAEAGETGVGEDDPVEFLMQHADAGQGLGRLLFRVALLGRNTTDASRASVVWGFIRTESPFTAPLSPAQVLLHLQCAIRAYDRGGAPELEPVIARLRALPPREAPIRGSALLAQLTFQPGRLSRDSADRRGLAAVYAALYRAAWREPVLWAETAALLEVLQIEPLNEQDWAQGWLRPWLADASEAGGPARAWANVLMNPSPRAWKEASGQPWGRLVESLLSDSLPAPTTPVLVLRDSLQLRSTPDPKVAEAAFRSLLELGRQGHWHAQALLEDFDARYRTAYEKRGASQSFQVHAREVAETLAAWRVEGLGFCRRDRDARWRAMGRALEFGSIRFSRADLETGAKEGSEAARVALIRLKALEPSAAPAKP